MSYKNPSADLQLIMLKTRRKSNIYRDALYDLILEKGYQDHMFGLPILPAGMRGRFFFAFERNGEKQIGYGSHNCSLQHIKASAMKDAWAREWLKTQITKEELDFLDLQHELQE